MVDIDRQWFKSRVGLAASETSRDISFCAYTILEETPNVMVVLDALKDSRFKANPLVIGPPYIRFYAGAAVIVNGFKIGAFCLIDDVPWNDFNAEQRQTLMDIGSIVSHMIELRRNKILEAENELARLSMSIVYGLKYPLRSLTNKSMQLSSTIDHINEWCQVNSYFGADKNCSSKDHELNSLMNILQHSITELQHSISHQSMLIESSLALSRSFIDHEKDSNVGFVDLERTNILALLKSLKSSVELALPSVRFEIILNPCTRVFANSLSQLTYPDVISLIVYSVVFNLMKDSPVCITLSVSFQESSKTVDNETSCMMLSFARQFDCTKPSYPATAISVGGSFTDSLPLNMECFDNLLRCVGGCYKVLRSRDKTHCHQITIPCEVLSPSTCAESAPVAPMVTTAAEETKTGANMADTGCKIAAAFHASIATASRRASISAASGRQAIKVLALQSNKLITSWLSAEGCAVVQARDGSDALKHLTGFFGFHLVLLDLPAVRDLY